MNALFMIPADSEAEACGWRRRAAASWSRSAPWIRKGTLAIVDQGFIAGSNFLLSVLLARWLRPEQYGAYTLAFSLFLLLAGVHQALLLDPMSVLGPAVHQDQRREYLGALLWMHAGLGLAIMMLLGVSTILVDRIAFHSDLAGALWGLTLAAPCILFFWLVRSAFYLELSPLTAAKGAVLYCVLVLGGLLVIYRYRALSPFSAFLLMAAGGIALGVLLLTKLKPILRLAGRATPLAQVWPQH